MILRVAPRHPRQHQLCLPMLIDVGVVVARNAMSSLNKLTNKSNNNDNNNEPVIILLSRKLCLYPCSAQRGPTVAEAEAVGDEQQQQQ